jgi:hypothetical protein
MIEPVAAEELDSARPIEEVRPWVESLCARYKTPEWNDHFVARRGLSNKIQGELVPLAHFSHHVASERRGSQLKYFPTSTQSFDAQVLSPDGSVQEVLEVTLACDGYRDAIAGEYLKKYGWAPLWVPLVYSGKRNARELPLPEMQSTDSEQIVEDGLTLIRNAVEAKSSSGKYEAVSLVVGLEDFRFLPRHIDGVKKELGEIRSVFDVVYYVGLEGRFFYAQKQEDRVRQK